MISLKNNTTFYQKCFHFIFSSIHSFITMEFWWFKDGKAKVTFDAREIRDKYDDHTRIESDEWFYIDENGKKIK